MPSLVACVISVPVKGPDSPGLACIAAVIPSEARLGLGHRCLACAVGPLEICVAMMCSVCESARAKPFILVMRNAGCSCGSELHTGNNAASCTSYS